MMTTTPKKIRQSIGEEIANAISHGAGALLAIAGTVIMLVRAAVSGSPISVVCAALYGASLIVLYGSSCLYHALQHAGAKKVFRIFDHCTIFLLIWGTYIPVALCLIGGALGWILFAFQGVCAVTGIIFNAIDLNRWSRVSIILYIMMGWAVIVTGPRVFSCLTAGGAALLVGGGVAYTLGILFYRARHKYMHFVWHLFVIAGSTLQYFFVLFYCL